MTVRVKPLPPCPDDLEVVWEVWRSVPLVPRSEEDCCDRLVTRVGVSGRDTARRWLSLLEGLGLVVDGPGGFARVRMQPAEVDLAAIFRERVYGADEVLDIVDTSGPLDTVDVFETFAPSVPPWERRRDADWQSAWRDRTARLLAWLALLGYLEAGRDGYRLR